jgi:two-component sensor histidine kinase
MYTSESYDVFKEYILELAEQGLLTEKEMLFKNFKGEEVHCYTNWHITDASMKIVILSIVDVTSHRKLEKELRQALKDKDFLIKEINHRVKNNLTVLQSLVSLQSSSIKDSTTKGYLEDFGNRIRTLSMVHERLYKTDDVHTIEMNDYISSLATQIYRSFVIDKTAIKLELDVSKTMLHMKEAIPCALIINELLTNAIKYAFPFKNDGKVTISFTEEQKGKYNLVIRDTGVGLPDGFDMNMSGGLGMKVVQALVSQLNGSLGVKGDKGTMFTINFRAEQS